MLEVFVNLLGSFLLSTTGFYVIKKITKIDQKFHSIRTIFLLITLATITVLMNGGEYKGIETLIIFLINIIIYKYIFRVSIEESTIIVGLMMSIMFISDMQVANIMKNFFNIQIIRTNKIIFLLSNILVCIIEIIIINIEAIREQLAKFYSYCKKKYQLINIIFIILLIIGFCFFTYNTGILYNKWDIKYILNIILIITLGLIAYIFIKNRNSYNQLTDEYDSLFSYIQNFEDWIEKEQLNRHEYKNQLAVLHSLTNEKKVKDKINEILEDNINIDGEAINQLKQLPKGGIKGLMYYKVAIAQKKKVKVTIDISLGNKSSLNKITEKDVRVICKLIGIYLDNAIEAAEETRNKLLFIEIYELSNKICFVFSNSFKKKDNFDDRNKKGVTTKGEGHGNGLYFASKLLESNDWLDSKQNLVDKFYIQQLIIDKKEHSNKNHD